MTVIQKQNGETDGADMYDSQPETERQTGQTCMTVSQKQNRETDRADIYDSRTQK